VAATIALGLGLQATLWRREKVMYVSAGRMIVNLKLSIPEGSLYTEELNNFLGTQAALMQSAAVLDRAQDRTQAPVLDLQPVTLKVFIQPKTTIFLLQGTGENGPYTKQFVQACMEEYINLKKEMRAQTSDTTLAGMTEEIARLEKELRKCDSDLVAFQSTNSVVLLQEQGNNAGTYLAGLNQRLAGWKSDREMLEAVEPGQLLEQAHSLASVAQFTESGPLAFETTGAPETDYLHTHQQVLLLKAEYEDLAKSLRPKHPRMIGLKEEISRRERLLGILREQTAQQLAARKQLVGLQISNLEKAVAEWDIRALEVSWKAAEFQRLKSNAQRTQALYDRLLATMQTLDVNRQISPESVTVMERASTPVPQRVRLDQRLLVGGAAGLLAGLVLLGFIDRLDDRLLSLSEVRELFPEDVLGQIPSEKLGLANGCGLLRTGDERYAWVEGYRNLRSALLFLGDPQHIAPVPPSPLPTAVPPSTRPSPPAFATSASAGRPGEGDRLRQRPRTVLVTSSVPGEGKSLTASNLAITLARGGAKVLLVDADLRKGVLHQLFGLNPSFPGVAEILSERTRRGCEDGRSGDGGPDWAAWVRPTEVSNLWLLPCGKQAEADGDVFVSAAITGFVEEAVKGYDFVILDTPPVMAADDATSLAPRVDGVLFVLRAGYTSARVARAALDLLYLRKARVLGLLFNAVRPGNADYCYHYHEYHTGRSHG
jgi:capsular exopolysaccharide synthesis family protein